MEILTVVGILGFLITAILGTLVGGQACWSIADARIQTSQQARMAIERMSQELRLSTAGNCIIDQIVAGRRGILIRFQVPLINPATGNFRLDGNGDLVWGAQGQVGWRIVYLVVGNNLVRRIWDLSNQPVGADTVLARHIAGVFFQGDPLSWPRPERIEITIVSSDTTTQGRIVQTTFTSEVALKN